MLKKLKDFFFETDINEDVDFEKQKIEQELLAEKVKYDKKDLEIENVTSANEIEQIKKQVMFVDEDFEKKSFKEDLDKTKYYSDSDKKFKPSQFISPVHGLLKDSEIVPEYDLEKKTTSENDYSVIRNKVFAKPDLNEHSDSSSFKIFRTSEIVDLKKRIQVDETASINENITIDEAMQNASNNLYVDTKSIVDDEDISQDLFDLLDELGGTSEKK